MEKLEGFGHAVGFAVAGLGQPQGQYAFLEPGLHLVTVHLRGKRKGTVELPVPAFREVVVFLLFFLFRAFYPFNAEKTKITEKEFD